MKIMTTSKLPITFTFLRPTNTQRNYFIYLYIYIYKYIIYFIYIIFQLGADIYGEGQIGNYG